eukprot:Colp12_sorted_trinity150504_noHs@343
MTHPKRNPTGMLFIGSAGIFFCYLLYGIIQERITKTVWGPEKEKFAFPFTLVLVQCIANAAAAYVGLQYSGAPPDKTPLRVHLSCAVSYITAMLCSNACLSYVSYPTQVLAKSCKPVPVLVMGVLVNRTRYPLSKYIGVGLIVSGICYFMLKEDELHKLTQGHGDMNLMGAFLLTLSLAMDGFTGSQQDAMKKKYHTTGYPMMFWLNVGSIVLLTFASVLTGELFSFLSFTARHPLVIQEIVLFALTSAAGQNFIFLTIEHCGPLTCSIVTTSRKFFTILASIVIFEHSLTRREWFGVGLVFLGLAIDTIFGKKHGHKSEKHDKHVKNHVEHNHVDHNHVDHKVKAQ